MRSWRFESKKFSEIIAGKAIGKSNVVIDDIATVLLPQNNCLMFATAKKFKTEFLVGLKNISNSCILIEPDLEEYFDEISKNNHIIVTTNARLCFALALKLITDEHSKQQKYLLKDNGIVIGENATIGLDCNFEPGIFIDNNVIIGNNVTIKTGAKIRQYVVIKDNSIIGENTVIGGQGFGVEKDFNGKNIRIPHIGGVIIGKNVEVGALTSIAAGTILPTTIGDNCFIDDLVHIGHNCSIGEGTMITASAQFGGSSKVGSNCFIAPNSTIRNGIQLGNNCFVGQASSVQKTYGDDMCIVGNPARPFERK